jgi:hypothetical protein
MQWAKIFFTLDEIRKALGLVPRLGLRRHTGGYPEGFEVYSGFEFGVGGIKNIEGARFVLYLSPRAAEDCTDLYYKDFPYEQCDKPDLEGQYVARALRQTNRADYEGDQIQ